MYGVVSSEDWRSPETLEEATFPVHSNGNALLLHLDYNVRRNYVTMRELVEQDGLTLHTHLYDEPVKIRSATVSLEFRF